MSSEESKPRKQICSWCEEAEPTIYCSNCKAYYCKECDEDRHKKGKPKEHKRMAVTGTDWKGEKSVITRMCPVHSNNIIEAFCENEKSIAQWSIISCYQN